MFPWTSYGSSGSASLTSDLSWNGSDVQEQRGCSSSNPRETLPENIQQWNKTKKLGHTDNQMAWAPLLGTEGAGVILALRSEVSEASLLQPFQHTKGTYRKEEEGLLQKV